MYFIDKTPDANKKLHVNCKTYSFVANKGQAINFFNKHNHIILEILAIKKGKMHLVTDNAQYILKEGEVAVINPLCLHFGEISGDFCEYVCFTANMKHWLSFCGTDAIKTAQSVLDEKYAFKEYYPQGNSIFPLILSLEKDFNETDIYLKCRFNAAVFSLYSELLKTVSSVKEKPLTFRNHEFMRDVAIYLEKNFKNDISTKDIAAAFYMTVPCFCYAFKHNFGTSFIKYLADFRITAAIRLASQENYTLSSLAEAVGFLDYNYFSRTFKKVLGVPPTEYFGKQKK